MADGEAATAEILNLRRFRKAQQRAEEEAAAGRNRAVFGRRKGERPAAKAAAERATHLLDGHHRDRSFPDDPESSGAGE